MTSPSRPVRAPLTAVRRFPIRAAVIVVLVLLAYNYSLLTLARGLTLQTPLAYLALVPLIALGLAAARLRLGPPEVQIHDRDLDWIVGLTLLAVTAAILVLVPQPETTAFWLARIDLLTLPIFVAGMVALLFGVRRMWALRFPILFLLLAWPVPFSLLLSATAEGFTQFTASAVHLIIALIPVARPVVGDETLLLVGSGSGTFGVSIGSACSGVNSFVGFVLMGAATLYLVHGPIIRRLAWLAVGLAIIMGLNLMRILAILVAGSMLGQEAALDILHPVAGLLVFNVGVLGMVTLVPRFGLRFASAPARLAQAGVPARPVQRARFATVVAIGIAAVLALVNAAYVRYESISSGVADARLAAFDIRTSHVPGWDARFVANVPEARQYFGETATWERVAYLPTQNAAVTSSRTVYLDVLTTDDAGTFAAYGIEACYTFHGFHIASVSQVDVGAAVTAQVIDYTNPETNVDWSALWWEWPYAADDGSTRYERVVIFMADGPQARFAGLNDVEVATQDARFVRTDRFLATLAREIVQAQLATDGTS